MLIYNIYFTPKDILRIDFVEDTLKLINPLRVIEGIKNPILRRYISKEDSDLNESNPNFR